MAESKTYHRLPYGVVAFVLQLFLGLIYGWSLFIAPLEADFGWARSDTSLIFTISMVFFCVGNLAAGTL
ncbi:MAG TPA: MFS transporter, partial [Candidatus Rubneribacter avistercoris]|nr:MFS transporter [Candidatus Rubneribacter avistercoris]